MSGYTKLFNSILASTIWREDDKTRIVWITLLAMADKHGVAEGSVPGLSDFARVSLSDCRAALAKLQAPDPDSRSDEYEGRRIMPIDGGWLLLNHGKYRVKLNEDERREYLRIKKAEERERARVNKCQQMSTPSTQPAPDPEADPDPEKIKTVVRSRALAVAYSPEFLEFWSAYPKRTGKGEAYRAWRKASPPLSVVLEALAWQSASEQWNRDGGRYRPNPATYLNQRRWEDEPANPAAYVPAPTVHGKGNASKAAAERVLAAREAARRANLLP